MMPDYREILHQGPYDCLIADFSWAYTQGITHAKQRELVTYPTTIHPRVFLQEAYWALKPHRNCWIWSDGHTLHPLLMYASGIGFTYRRLCVIKRRRLGLGYFIRKQVYFLLFLSKGNAYKIKDAWLSEYLGEYLTWRSQKPQEVYEKLLAHSLPPGGTWCDPFPASHEEVYRKKGA